MRVYGVSVIADPTEVGLYKSGGVSCVSEGNVSKSNSDGDCFSSSKSSINRPAVVTAVGLRTSEADDCCNFLPYLLVYDTNMDTQMASNMSDKQRSGGSSSDSNNKSSSSTSKRRGKENKSSSLHRNIASSDIVNLSSSFKSSKGSGGSSKKWSGAVAVNNNKLSKECPSAANDTSTNTTSSSSAPAPICTQCIALPLFGKLLKQEITSLLPSTCGKFLIVCVALSAEDCCSSTPADCSNAEEQKPNSGVLAQEEYTEQQQYNSNTDEQNQHQQSTCNNPQQMDTTLQKQEITTSDINQHRAVPNVCDSTPSSSNYREGHLLVFGIRSSNKGVVTLSDEPLYTRSFSSYLELPTEIISLPSTGCTAQTCACLCACVCADGAMRVLSVSSLSFTYELFPRTSALKINDSFKKARRAKDAATQQGDIVEHTENTSAIQDPYTGSDRFRTVTYCQIVGVERLCVGKSDGTVQLVNINRNDGDSCSSDEGSDAATISFSTDGDELTSKRVQRERGLITEQPISYESARRLLTLTHFQPSCPRLTASVPPCWVEMTTAQQQRRNPQHLQQQAAESTRCWTLYPDSSSWDEHLFELLMGPSAPSTGGVRYTAVVPPPAGNNTSMTIGHITLKLQLAKTRPHADPNIEVTLLRQNLRNVATNSITTNSRLDDSNSRRLNGISDDGEIEETGSKGDDGKNKKSLLSSGNDDNKAGDDAVVGNVKSLCLPTNICTTADFLQSHHAEIVSGPISVGQCLELSGNAATITFTAPQLFTEKGRSAFLLHIKSMAPVTLVEQQSLLENGDASSQDDECSACPCASAIPANEKMYYCKDCSVDGTCVLCMSCFQASAHIRHQWSVGTSRGTGAIKCSCGKKSAWLRFPTCSLHDKQRTLPFMPSASLVSSKLSHLSAILIMISKEHS